MRDVVATVVAALLVFFALRLATSLTRDRIKRRQRRTSLQAKGQSVLAEVPTEFGLMFFTEDQTAFHFGDRIIVKDSITSARVLINGVPIASIASTRITSAQTAPHNTVADRLEGLARDRWDVIIETDSDSIVVPCGEIRERISQELARAIFDAVKNTME